MIELAETAMSLSVVLARQRRGEMVLPCRVEALGAQEVRAIEAASWNRLSRNALEENPWLSRQMVLAGLDQFEDEKTFRSLAFYGHRGGELLGLMPFRVSGPPLFKVGRPALNLYQVGGAPLIDKDHAQIVIASLLGLMTGRPGMPRHWIFPHVATKGRFSLDVQRLAKQFGLETFFAAGYERPLLTRAAGDFGCHVEQVIGKKRAKDIERNLRRLEKLGTLTFERATEPDEVAERFEDFLRIEAGGWKGERGTAFLCRPGEAEYARSAFSGRSGMVSVDSLLLDGQVIAVSVNMATGQTLFTPKCAFDERFRKYGPGMALEYKVIERFFADNEYAQMDAATTVDGHIISGLWDDKRSMAMLIVGPAGLTTRGLAGAINGATDAKTWLKRVLRRS